MNRSNYELKSWNRFLSRNLAVTSEVIGQKHEFRFQDSTVALSIPSADQVTRPQGYDELASIGARWAATGEPIYLHIHKVDLQVRIQDTVSLPVEIVTRNANAYELLSSSEQDALNNAAERHQVVAERAFTHWTRIMRWVCDDSRIGRSLIEDFHSGWSTQLYAVEADVKLWIQSQTLHVCAPHAVSLAEWQQAQDCLTHGNLPPVYIELKHDAEESLKQGDLRRSLIDLAIACETYLKLAVSASLPQELRAGLRHYIEKANVSQYYEEFFPEVLEQAEKAHYRALKPHLKNLFERRNRLVHTGMTDAIDESHCREALEATNGLFRLRQHTLA